MPKPDNRRYKGPAGRIGENRILWFKSENLECILYEVLEENADDELSGPTYSLSFRRKGRPPVSVNMSDFTEAEITHMTEFFTETFALALPVTILRDKVADDAFQAGDDSYHRLYRPLSQLVRRPRPSREHDEGVPVGSQSIPRLDGADGDPDGSVRVPGSAVAERAPEDGSPEDYGTPFDLNP